MRSYESGTAFLDVSVMDTYIVLMIGGTWYALGKEEFGDYQVLYDELPRVKQIFGFQRLCSAEVCVWLILSITVN